MSFPNAVTIGYNVKLNHVILFYRALPNGEEICDTYSSSRGLLLRNWLFHRGNCYANTEIGETCFANCRANFVCIPQNIAILRKASFANFRCSMFVFEWHSRLEIIERDALAFVRGLKCICFPIDSIMFSRFSCTESSISTLFFGEQSLDSSPNHAEVVLSASIVRWTQLSESAFSSCSSLKSISIPVHVEVLGDHCFSSYSSLAEVSFESGSRLRRLGEWSFSTCSSLKSICIPANVEVLDKCCFNSCFSLSEIAFESGSKLTRLGQFAFSECSLLKFISIPSTVEIIDECCFNSYSVLSEIAFESDSQLQQIGRFAFLHCVSLKSSYIPAFVEIIEDSAFSRCGLSQIIVDEENSNFRILSDCLVDVRRSFLIQSLGSGEFFSIVYECRRICDGCFYQRHSLVAVEFESESRVVEIGEAAFSKCFWLRSICIPSSVGVLGNSCFNDCVTLSAVSFESRAQLHYIGAFAFDSCVAIDSVCLPASVEVIGDYGFAFCMSLSTLTLESGSKLRQLGRNVFTACWALRSLLIPSSVTVLPNGCFKWSEFLSAVTFEPGSKVNRIVCRSRLTIPSSVEHIDESCCQQCVSLAEVAFESGSKLVTIGDFAFECCRSLLSICIPSSVTILGRCCFGSCVSLSRVIFESGSKLQAIKTCAFRECRALKSICIPASVEALEESCFAAGADEQPGCSSLLTVTFESGSALNRIDSRAFRNCILLTSISIPASVRILSNGWALGSGLKRVIFESGESLRSMLVDGSIDLNDSCELIVGQCEEELILPVYSTEIIPEMPNFMRVAKISLSELRIDSSGIIRDTSRPGFSNPG
jgi:hypothetical protein